MLKKQYLPAFFCNFSIQILVMKNYAKIIGVFILLLGIITISCTAKKPENTSKQKHIASKSDTIRIANDSLEYEVIIIDNGFNNWLNSRSLPRNYHSLFFLENKNQLYVNEWNNRVLQPQQFNTNLYEMRIDYSPNIKYGYEVNYLIYNYMIYFQNTYNQRLFGYVPIR
jgi:hypothetical protein